MITEKEFEQIKVGFEIASDIAGNYVSDVKVVKLSDIIAFLETYVEIPQVHIASTLYRTPDNAVAPFGGKDGFGNQLYAGQATGVCPK
jgi:hypothetical protein